MALEQFCAPYPPDCEALWKFRWFETSVEWIDSSEELGPRKGVDCKQRRSLISTLQETGIPLNRRKPMRSLDRSIMCFA